MKKNKDGSFFVGVTISASLFEELERARMTKRGRIPRNEFIRTAITKMLESSKRREEEEL